MSSTLPVRSRRKSRISVENRSIEAGDQQPHRLSPSSPVEDDLEERRISPTRTTPPSRANMTGEVGRPGRRPSPKSPRSSGESGARNYDSVYNKYNPTGLNSAIDVKSVSREVVDLLAELILEQQEYAHAAKHINGACEMLSESAGYISNEFDKRTEEDKQRDLYNSAPAVEQSGAPKPPVEVTFKEPSLCEEEGGDQSPDGHQQAYLSNMDNQRAIKVN
eukprot:sb/3469862/